ncbi:hypothetical protein FIU97_14900 [Roseivivax sp. THAF40]|uniref:hypothetical protein n=1 Tax=unclassified Roseivivax TaxID=2639302 RepID=UPI001267C382|nr:MULTISPECIES: hypothetical protein [unclassified Roseivivax]QFS84041.1 hypothetical protein FIV09_14490 [Roseivivax sp. THAF197b]QFT47868.1 hypothetical protein FIU97_14900 [Roseivivax sp. THAF40]
MARVIPALALAACTALPAAAQDFSEGSEANEWGLWGEQKARFEARVVDPICVLSSQCDDACAPGRQSALLRSADDALIMPLKNNQPIFTGAAADLAPFCGQQVEVDGLMIENPENGATHVYQVQRIRALPDGEWAVANRFTDDWADAHPDAAGDGPWFRRDPRINAEIATEGYLGLGVAQEEAFLKDWLGIE